MNNNNNRKIYVLHARFEYGYHNFVQIRQAINRFKLEITTQTNKYQRNDRNGIKLLEYHLIMYIINSFKDHTAYCGIIRMNQLYVLSGTCSVVVRKMSHSTSAVLQYLRLEEDTET